MARRDYAMEQLWEKCLFGGWKTARARAAVVDRGNKATYASVVAAVSTFVAAEVCEAELQERTYTPLQRVRTRSQLVLEASAAATRQALTMVLARRRRGPNRRKQR